MTLDRNEIRKLALDCGFVLKQQVDGHDDINEYVYKFAEAIADYAISVKVLAGQAEAQENQNDQR